MSSVFNTSPYLHIKVVPTESSARLVRIRTVDTAAIAASASPRNPSVAIASRSPGSRILLVACLKILFGTSSLAMPQPSSVIRIKDVPPSFISTVTHFAPASAQFSNISLIADAGRSTTSPAAIKFAVCLSSTLITPIYAAPLFM